jgi:hypothetical protein
MVYDIPVVVIRVEEKFIRIYEYLHLVHNHDLQRDKNCTHLVEQYHTDVTEAKPFKLLFL